MSTFLGQIDRQSFDGITCVTRRWGPDARVQLIHGFLGHSLWWAWFAEHWGQSVYAHDLSGMGLSDWRTSYYFEDHVREVTRSIDRPTVLIGHSYGGLCAYAAASQSKDVQAVVMIDSPTIQWLLEPEPRAKIRMIAMRDMREVRQRFRLIPEQPPFERDVMDFLAENSVRTVPGGYEWLFDPHVNQISAHGQADFLQPCRVPLLYIRATRSPANLHQGLSQLCHVNPAAKIVDVDAYHALLVDQAAVCVSLITDWLKSHDVSITGY